MSPRCKIFPTLVFIRISGMPSSELKGASIRQGTPLSLEDARRPVEDYVEHYNNVRLNSAIGYINPTDMLAGPRQAIHAKRDMNLERARKQRQIRRRQGA